MKKMNFLLTSLTLTALLVSGCHTTAEPAPTGKTAGAEIRIDTEDFGIAVRPAVPDLGRKCELAVRITGADPSLPMTVTAEVDGKALGSSELKEGEKLALFSFQPETTGWKTARATVRQGQQETTAEFRFPVTSRRLHFPWFGWNDKEGKVEKCRFPTMMLARNPEDIAYWKHRGVMAGRWKDGRYRGKTVEACAAYWPQKTEGFDAIMIDEIGGYESESVKNSPRVQGLAKYCKEKTDDLFVALWVPGVLRESLAGIAKNVYRKKGVDLLMLETYINYLEPELKSYYPSESLRQRIDMARKQDVLTHSIITIGIHGMATVRPLSREDMEDQVRQIKRMAPEMPGLCVYASTKKMQNRDLIFFADHLCGKYYVAPVLTVLAEAVQISDPAPVRGSAVRIRGKVTNVGGMDSGPVTVRFYDGNPANGGKLIGARRIEQVKSLRDGKDFPKGAPVEVEWTAGPFPGSHEIYMEILPEDPKDTLLDHLARRAVMVR
ncbi:MAG: hypothetical protein IJS14_01370 [Lentisphaeria bacterium]|nr:hypothetical protein [Lentisphaeria bacterium]